MATLTIYDLLEGYCAVLKRNRIKHRRPRSMRARVFAALSADEHARLYATRPAHGYTPTDIWRSINHRGDGCNVTWSYFIRLAREYRRANT